MTCKNKFDHDSILHIVPTGANRIPHNIYMNDFQTVTQLRSGLKRYFEFYNHERLHQSLDYQTPNEVHFL